VTPRRMHDDECNDSSERIFPIITAETLRNAASAHHHPKTTKPAEERISLFWRIFGGTILSIVALVILTACQSVYSSIRDMQKDIAHLNEGKAEFVRADEYSATRTKAWERMADIQKDISAQSMPISQLKDRVVQLEEQCKTLGSDRKDAQELSATLKERLTQFEQQLTAVKTSQKDVQTVQQTLSALQEKMTLRDQQFTQLEEERKDMLKELQSLRERVARIEATKEPQVPTKPPTVDGKSAPAEDGPSAAKR
jgi:DNA repair ATPase RecN